MPLAKRAAMYKNNLFIYLFIYSLFKVGQIKRLKKKKNLQKYK